MILLPTETVELYAPDGTADEHGWTLPPSGLPRWTGPGALQIGYGSAGNTADSSGGSGPFAPDSVLLGTGYLPLEASPADGMVVTGAAGRYVLSGTHWVGDPTGGDLGCWVATLTAAVVAA